MVKASHLIGAKVPLDPSGISGPTNFLRHNLIVKAVSSGSRTDGL